MPVLYQSPVTRWVLATTGFIAGAALTFGSAAVWRSTPSLHWLQWRAHIPLRFIGVLFLLYAAGLLFDRCRSKAFTLGAALCALFAISILVASHLTTDQPRNVIVLAFMIDCTAFHAFAVRATM